MIIKQQEHQPKGNQQNPLPFDQKDEAPPA
jgi:hypothetical protein